MATTTTTAPHLTHNKAYDLDEIKKQVEYYLSDGNLKKDSFFHNMIQTDPNHAVSIEALMKCNKINSMKIAPEILIEAIEKSTEVEVLPTRTGIKRKHDKALPELEAKVAKKVKTEGADNSAVHTDTIMMFKEENKNEKDAKSVTTPLIFTLKTEKHFLKGRREIQEKLEEAIGISVPYCRFAKVEGNFVVEKSALSEEKKNEIVNNGITIDGTKIIVQVAEDETLKTFYDKHGDHYNSCVNGKGKHPKDKHKDKKTRNNRSGKIITFGNEKYSDITKLKNIFKNMISQVTDGEVIKEPHHTMLLELLKYHSNHDEKTKDLQSFTVGPHPQYDDSRCFFVVRKDGTKEDFSTKKCLEKLEEKLN